MLIRFITGIILLTVLNGCASMINHYQDRAEVYGPHGMTATDPKGDSLTIYREELRQFVSLPTYDTFVTFHYGKTSESVMLNRSFNWWTLLDIETWGIGFIVDDATGGWQGYDPLYVYLDPDGGADSTLQSYHPNIWESENRPRLLVGGAWGINSLFALPAGADIFVPPYYEYFVGLSYRKQ